jgi:hypothetical protein
VILGVGPLALAELQDGDVPVVLVKVTGRVDAQQDLDLLDVLEGDLIERVLSDRDLVGGAVRRPSW